MDQRIKYMVWNMVELDNLRKGANVTSLFYSYKNYVVIVYPIESHYYYYCALTLVLLYY